MVRCKEFILVWNLLVPVILVLLLVRDFISGLDLRFAVVGDDEALEKEAMKSGPENESDL